MQTIPLYASTPNPMSTADDNYDSWQETEYQWQVHLWRRGPAACLCQNLQTILGPKGGDVNRTEWRKVITESQDSDTSRTSYWHTLCCSLILLCAIIFVWIVK